MCLFLAGIAHKQLLVSPKTKNASGCNSSKRGSMLIRIFPIVSVAVDPAAFKK
jgi:hypothetical protein